jgi:hypothetical protein
MSNDAIDLDPSRYFRSPVLDVPGAIALGIALLTAHKTVSKKLPVPARRAAKVVRAGVLDLQSRWDGQRAAALASEEDKRPADLREDRAFAAVAMRLEALTLLPETIADSRRATKLYTRLFPGGLVFLKLPYERQWAECEQRLRDIADGDIAEELRELVGAVALDELRAAHKNYGRALGITSAKTATPSAPKVAEQLRAVLQSVADYALQLVAAAKADPELGSIVVGCLRPLDALREAEARRGAGASSSAPATPAAETPTVTPTTPIPDLDDN